MRIVSIDIENYGALNDFHINFSENPYIIIEENGWGKSTLASFLRVMFFGFEDESKKKVDERERHKYKPWNNGTYGGDIVFEANDKTYRLRRTFGSKAAEDKSELFDATTKLVTADYDVNSIGEQLFGINKDAYIRSLFLGQGNLEVRNDKDNIEDTITAKIGNLTEATDDVNNFESVLAKLQKASYALKSGNKKGEINILNSIKTQYIAEINKESALSNEIDKAEKDIVSITSELDSYKGQLKKLNKEYELAGMLDAYKEKENNYKQLKQELADVESEIRKINSKFENRIPNPDETEGIAECIKKAKELKAKCDQTRKLVQDIKVSQAQTGTIPSKDKLSNVLLNIRKREEIKTKISNEESQLKHERDMLEMRKDVAYRDWKREEEAAQARYQSEVDRLKTSSKTYQMVLFIVGAIIILAAVFTLVSARMVIGIAALVVGVVLLTGGVLISSVLKKKIEQIEIVKTEAQPEFLAEENELQTRAVYIENQKDKLMQISDEITTFCAENDLADNELLETEVMNMQAKLASMSQNTDILEEFEKTEHECEQEEDTIRRWLCEIGVKTDRDWMDIIYEIRQNIRDYSALQKKKEMLAQRIDESDFEKIDNIEETENIRQIDDIKDEKEKVDLSIDQLRSVCDDNRNYLDSLYEQRNAIEETKEKLANLDDKLKEYEHKYDIINKTMDYLSKAKEQLSARYLDPIEDAFTKYYSYITTDYIDKYEVDADINISRQEMGHSRSKNSLSQGYKDLVDISLRMALIDVMYKEEKPWVILDDPFVNLDSEKLKQVKEFIEEISREYQVIYFTCHESRA